MRERSYRSCSGRLALLVADQGEDLTRGGVDVVEGALLHPPELGPPPRLAQILLLERADSPSVLRVYSRAPEVHPARNSATRTNNSAGVTGAVEGSERDPFPASNHVAERNRR